MVGRGDRIGAAVDGARAEEVARLNRQLLGGAPNLHRDEGWWYVGYQLSGKVWNTAWIHNDKIRFWVPRPHRCGNRASAVNFAAGRYGYTKVAVDERYKRVPA